MKILHRDCLEIYAIHDQLRGLTLQVDMKRIHLFGHGFHYKWPEQRINHLWPVPHAVQQKGARTKSQLFVSVLNDAILMMRTYTAEGDLLTFVIDILVKSFVCKTTIVSVVMSSGLSSLLQYLFIRSLSE